MTTTQRAQTIARPTNRLAVDAPDPDAENLCGEYVRTHDDDPWYPTEGAHSPDKVKRDAAYAIARSICQTCPMRTACLEAAMDIEGRRDASSRWGMWGKLDPIERHLLARRLGKRTPGSRLKPIDHGTPAGARMHYRRGIPLCDRCADADNVARAERGASDRKRRAS